MCCLQCLIVKSRTRPLVTSLRSIYHSSLHRSLFEMKAFKAFHTCLGRVLQQDLMVSLLVSELPQLLRICMDKQVITRRSHDSLLLDKRLLSWFLMRRTNSATGSRAALYP